MFTVVFHSFKGGAGRSVTAFNTLPFLAVELGATADNPILVIDMDIDSCGMTYLFDKQIESHNSEYDIKRFFVQPINRFQMSKDDPFENHVFFKCTFPVGDKVGVDPGAIRFFGVDDRNDEEFNQESVNEKDLERIITACKNRGFKAARTSIVKSDIVVSCMRPSRQFRTGSFSFLGRLVNENLIGRESRVVINPTCVPIGGVEFLKQLALDDFNVYISNFTKHIELYADRYENLLVKGMIEDSHFGIPEVDRFKWDESNLNLESQERPLLSDEKLAIEKYNLLAKTIVNAALR